MLCHIYDHNVHKCLQSGLQVSWGSIMTSSRIWCHRSRTNLQLYRYRGCRRVGGMSPHDSMAMGAMSPDMALFGMVWLLGLKAELRRLEAVEEAASRSPGIFTVEPPPSPFCKVHGYRMRHPPNKKGKFSLECVTHDDIHSYGTHFQFHNQVIQTRSTSRS